MTIGDGILWSTLLVLLSVAIYQVSIRQKWKLLGKIIGLVILVCVAGGAGLWAWYKYSNRPSPVLELNGVRLGMSPVEVKLAKGSPTAEATETGDKQDREFKLGWVFSSDGSDERTEVIFYGPTTESAKASIVCGRGGYSTVLGLGRFNSKKDVIEKLGQPTAESISKDALSKLMSFKPFNVAFELTKDQVTAVCVAESGRVGYIEEYSSSRK
jgi:hypothetical protein